METNFASFHPLPSEISDSILKPILLQPLIYLWRWVVASRAGRLGLYKLKFQVKPRSLWWSWSKVDLTTNCFMGPILYPTCRISSKLDNLWLSHWWFNTFSARFFTGGVRFRTASWSMLLLLQFIISSRLAVPLSSPPSSLRRRRRRQSSRAQAKASMPASYNHFTIYWFTKITHITLHSDFRFDPCNCALKS